MDNKEIGLNYFGIRVNISKSLTIENLTNYLAKYEHVLACFENGDKDVKNPHSHILIWGYTETNKEFEKKFEEDIKLNLKGVRGNGRFAIEHQGKDFYTSACRYVCKGKIDTLPIIIKNTDFSEIMIKFFWTEWWSHQLAIVAKEAQDTSMRNIQKIWNKFTNERLDFEIAREDEKNCLLNIRLKRAKLFEFWYNNCIDYYEEEFKEFDDIKVLGVIQGLMLKTDKELFRKSKLEKLAHLAGLGKFDKQYLMPDNEEYQLT